jgi:hypothetical protein
MHKRTARSATLKDNVYELLTRYNGRGGAIEKDKAYMKHKGSLLIRSMMAPSTLRQGDFLCPPVCYCPSSRLDETMIGIGS